jgi:hypothetical protein
VKGGRKEGRRQNEEWRKLKCEDRNYETSDLFTSGKALYRS